MPNRRYSLRWILGRTCGQAAEREKTDGWGTPRPFAGRSGRRGAPWWSWWLSSSGCWSHGQPLRLQRPACMRHRTPLLPTVPRPSVARRAHRPAEHQRCRRNRKRGSSGALSLSGPSWPGSPRPVRLLRHGARGDRVAGAGGADRRARATARCSGLGMAPRALGHACLIAGQRGRRSSPVIPQCASTARALASPLPRVAWRPHQTPRGDPPVASAPARSPGR